MHLHVRYTPCLAVLILAAAFTLAQSATAGAAEVTHEAVRAAVAKALPLVEGSAATYVERRDCFSCHHQALTAMALSEAAGRGFEVDAEGMRAQSEFTTGYFGPRKKRLHDGRGVPGGPYTAGYALVSLDADRWPAGEAAAALVAYLRATQEDDGSWRIRTHRPPLEDSHFTATALAVRGLKLYAGKEQAQTDEQEQKEREDQEPSASPDRIARARQWLLTAEPESNEDRAMQLLGLDWSGAPEEKVRAAARRLLALQRDDGGWSQTAEMASDAYATGQALFALEAVSALGPDTDARDRGLRYLLDTQEEDGSWRVASRSKPIQTYFESGFPHGKDQFVSIAATCWAAMALTAALPEDEPAD